MTATRDITREELLRAYAKAEKFFEALGHRFAKGATNQAEISDQDTVQDIITAGCRHAYTSERGMFDLRLVPWKRRLLDLVVTETGEETPQVREAYLEAIAYNP